MMNSFIPELLLLTKSPKVKLNVLIGIVILVGFPFYLSLFEQSLGRNMILLLDGAFNFPYVYNTVIIFQYYFNYLFGVLLIMMTCERFEYSTYKLALINGSTRSDLWENSIYFTLLTSAFLTMISFAMSISIGLIKSSSAFTLEGAGWIAIYFIQTFILLTYAVSFSLIFKHAGTAINVYIIWFLFVERIIAQYMDFNFGFYPLFRFLPGKVVEDLTYMVSGEGMIIHHLDYYEWRFLAALLWMIISLCLNHYIFKKTDYAR